MGRAEIRASREGICHYCGEAPGTTADHIIPRTLGGPNRRWNLVPSCQPCNLKKGSRLPWCRCDQCLAALRWYETQESPKSARPQEGPPDLGPLLKRPYRKVTMTGIDGSRWVVEEPVPGWALEWNDRLGWVWMKQAAAESTEG